MKKTAKTAKKKAEIGLYRAVIKILGKNYEATGATPREAIASLVVGRVAKGMSVLTVSTEGRTVSKILPAPQTFRLFSASKLMREVALKNVSLMFQGL